MAYNDENVNAKLSTLNDTAESVQTLGQWIMFHRRYADRTAGIWLERIKDSTASRRLTLLYLANEIVQNNKIRKRDDFINTFAPILPESISISYRGASAELRDKIKRLVQVWRDRDIFDDAIQGAIESRIKDIDSSQGGGKKLLGGSLFSGTPGSGPAAPAELKPLIPLQEAVNKARVNTGAVVPQAETDAKEVTENPASAVPVRIARYNKALKSLSQAESAVANGIQARQNLLGELEKLVKQNRDALQEAEEKRAWFQERSATITDLKQQDEDAIMRRLPKDEDESTPTNGDGDTLAQPGSAEHELPETEELTPPPVEEITPAGSPAIEPAPVTSLPQFDGTAPEAVSWGANESAAVTGYNTPELGADLLASLSRPFSSTDMANEDPAAKRQRLEQSAGLEDDVNDLINQERGGA